MTLPTATTPLQKALLTRAFFLHRSQGSFNPLFTGNGYTATGVGAVSRTFCVCVFCLFLNEEKKLKTHN